MLSEFLFANILSLEYEKSLIKGYELSKSNAVLLLDLAVEMG